jgi:GTP-binding protein
MKFVDQVRVHAKAGDGGSGCCSFRREKYIPRGGPDGGNGGAGGSIILRADHDTSSLVSFYYEPLIKGKSGGRGQGSDKVGRCAPDLVLRVPVGTLVYEAPAPKVHDPLEVPVEEVEEQPVKRRLDPRGWRPLHDLAEPGQEVILCAGGRGGRGNASFKSSINRAPRQFTEGEEGEEGWFLFELRTIAFAGLVGYPNAGKSTLLQAISAARPKVAAYPFTTLHPHVGVVEVGEFDRVTVADIPGLIEGAHENRGLGHEFLRHILRCRHLLFVVDAAGSEGRDPVEDLITLRTELDLYDAMLSAKPWSIVANKTDLPGAEENLPRLRQKFRKQQILPAAVKSGEGVEEIQRHLAELFKTAAGATFAESGTEA